jgi:hypothetical protein
MPHPSTTPLALWPHGWLVLEVARLLDRPRYILMLDLEKRNANLPVTKDEMRDYIQRSRDHMIK